MNINYKLIFSEMERKGIPMAHAARAIGMSRQNLHLIKKNNGELTGTQLIILLELLGSPIDMFVTKEE